MTWYWLVLIIVVLGVTAAVAAGYGGSMYPAYQDRPDVRLPAGRPLSAEDLDNLEFSVALRGYRMDEVDAVIGRLTAEIAERDVELARCREALPGRRQPATGRQ